MFLAAKKDKGNANIAPNVAPNNAICNVSTIFDNKDPVMLKSGGNSLLIKSSIYGIPFMKFTGLEPVPCIAQV